MAKEYSRLLLTLGTCRSSASSAILDNRWFQEFIDLYDGGFHKGYEFVGLSYEFSTLEEFIRHKAGLDANPVNLYQLVATAAALNKPPESRKVLKIFDENGIDKLLDPSDLEILKKPGIVRGLTKKAGKPGNPNPSGKNQYSTKERENEGLGNCYNNNVYLKPSDSVGRRGTDQEYLAARIARDRPDILKRMEQGEYRSVRAAAIDAGIIKPKPTKTIKQGESVKRTFQKLRVLFTDEELTELKTLIEESLCLK